MSSKKKRAAKTAKKSAPRKAAPKVAKKKTLRASAKKKVTKAKLVAKAKPAAKAKTVAKAKPAAKAKVKASAKSALKRRDGTGHLDPKYAKDLLARSRAKPKDDDRAFLAKTRSKDSMTEERGEEFVSNATSGEGEGGEIRDQRVAEEVGGPFVITSAGTEFADGTDESNPRRATREPFPRT
jgi:hypothetical protein